MKKITRHGKFHHKHLSTCPVLPKFHCAYGEPTELEPEHVESNPKRIGQSIQSQSMKLICRIDSIELENETQEVFVKDDFGIHVMYECTLTDMRLLE